MTKAKLIIRKMINAINRYFYGQIQYDEIERIPYEYCKNAFITIKVIALMCDCQKKMMYYKAEKR